MGLLIALRIHAFNFKYYQIIHQKIIVSQQL